MKRALQCLAMLAWLAIWCALAATLAGCDRGGSSSAGTSLGERVYDVTEAAWYARGDLPPIRDDGDCERLPLLEVLAPATVSGYRAHCPANSWACVAWVPLPGRVRSLNYPVAVMHPLLPAARWPAHAIHELIHAMAGCAGIGGTLDHLDPRLWEGTAGDPHPDSVESVAERSIYDPGPLIDEPG